MNYERKNNSTSTQNTFQCPSCNSSGVASILLKKAGLFKVVCLDCHHVFTKKKRNRKNSKVSKLSAKQSANLQRIEKGGDR